MEEPGNRRDFFRLLGSGVGLALLAPINRVDWDNWGILRAIRQRLWVTRFGRPMIRRFHSAPTGTLMYYYQHFFPVFLQSESFDKLLSFRKLCGEELNRDVDKWHRILCLPGVAAAHALSSLRGDEAEEARELITAILKSALDTESDNCNREALEMLWMNLTCALLRSEHNWSALQIGSNLVREAESVCTVFSNNKDETLPLLYAAMAAWQFLLTYERALSARRDPLAVRERAEVLGAMERIGGLKTPRMVWLAALAKQYSSRFEYRSMLAQPWEVVMCRPKLSDADREAADLFILMRLKMAHINERVRQGNIKSRYLRGKQQAVRLETGSFAFLKNYGVTQTDWNHLRVSLGHYFHSGDLADALSDKELSHADMLFETFRSASDLEKPEEGQCAQVLARTVSLRRFGEESSIHMVLRNPAVALTGFLALREKSGDLFKRMIEFWRPSINDGLQKLDCDASQFTNDQAIDALQVSSATEAREGDVSELQKQGVQDYTEAVKRFQAELREHITQLEKIVVKQQTTILTGISFSPMGERDPVVERKDMEKEAATTLPTIRWRRKLKDYGTDEKIGVSFTEIAQVDEVLKLVWDTRSEFYRMPWVYVGAGLLIVPADAWLPLNMRGYSVSKALVHHRGNVSNK